MSEFPSTDAEKTKLDELPNDILWQQYKENPHDVDIRNQIVLNYQNLVHYIIHNSKFITLPVLQDGDYFGFGIEGLMEAIDRFDPDYGTKFETYAIQRIRGKIIDEIRKVQIKPRVLNSDDEQPRYLNISLDAPSDGEDDRMILESIVNVHSPNPLKSLEKKEQKENLMKAFEELTREERLILGLYYWEEKSYQEIADVLGITVSRISQKHDKSCLQLGLSLLKDGVSKKAFSSTLRESEQRKEEKFIYLEIKKIFDSLVPREQVLLRSYYGISKSSYKEICQKLKLNRNEAKEALRVILAHFRETFHLNGQDLYEVFGTKGELYDVMEKSLKKAVKDQVSVQ
ncbi:sigma-70 family RNA polymerase sigma factor [Candidatus Gracilibacteria bacterium]|nr:sigma-70 family RNA polymerase sigma factor [Candidatus Gracilibacteria bacterium]